MKRLLVLASVLIVAACAVAQTPVIVNPVPGTGVRFCGFTTANAVPIMCSSGIASGGFSAALAYSKVAPVNIVVVGDEGVVCDAANCGMGPVTSSNRWAERLRVALQQTYGSAGSGLVPALSAFSPVATLNSEAWSCTSGWATSTALGPSQNGTGSLVVIPAGGQCTFADTRDIPWNALDVFCGTTSDSTDLQVSIDGGQLQHACNTTTSTPTVHVVTISTTSSTSHSVTFSSPSGPSYLYGAAGRDTTRAGGVAVSDVAIAGATAGAFGTSPTAQLAFSDAVSDGVQFVLLSEGQANDALAGTATSTFQSQLAAIVAHELSVAGNGRVVAVIPPADVVGTQFDLTHFISAQVSLCGEDNLQCANLAATWGAYNPATGLWDSTGDTGVVWQPGDSFGVLLNDVGSYAAFKMIVATITN